MTARALVALLLALAVLAGCGQTTEVRDSEATEAQFTPPVPGSDLYNTFKKLVSELEARLPGECRRTATSSH